MCGDYGFSGICIWVLCFITVWCSVNGAFSGKLQSLGEDFLKNGGMRERMTRMRLDRRK